MDTEKKTSFVKNLDKDEMLRLREILTEKSWEITDAQYCHFKAVKEKTSVAAYLSGKLVVQGRGASDFIEFILEPLILGEKAFEEALKPPVEPEKFVPHAGIDESGKGDFFGPLVVACAFVGTEEQAFELEKAGVKDSKLIKDDRRITAIAAKIRTILDGRTAVVSIGSDAYNRLYASFGNLNKLLAWGHARSLENLLEKAPECRRALADKFGNEHFIKDALLKRGKSIILEQRTKAESDCAVAAASILARAEFVRKMSLLSSECGITLPKGAGAGVDRAAAELVSKGGAGCLAMYTKTHFRTYAKVLGLEVPEKKPFVKRANGSK